MRRLSGLWIFLALMIILDIYVFQVIRFVTYNIPPKLRLAIIIGYWIVSGLSLLFFALMPYLNYETWPKALRTYIFATLVGLFFAKLLSVTFFLLDDFRRGVQWIAGKLFFSRTEAEIIAGEGISRSAFLSWVGLAVGGGLFSTLIYGFSNKYNYNLNRVRLSFENLPASFKGLKIAHISDIHSGSFNNKEAVTQGVEKILKEKPDLILFTGDLVNDAAHEMDDYKELFARLKAPRGVFSTLGNHDYGDYRKWDSPGAKAANLERLKNIHAEMGWRLLMNEHVPLEIDGEQIAIIGIENWSAKAHFQKYGKMDKAYAGAENYPFKILLSHDPSHWDAEVRPKYSDVDLMLSGHTHGMQFGVDIPGLRWSPVQYVYKQWAGLYESGRQKLYINRGFGFIGYPGRVGILPEITIIDLA